MKLKVAIDRLQADGWEVSGVNAGLHCTYLAIRGSMLDPQILIRAAGWSNQVGTICTVLNGRERYYKNLSAALAAVNRQEENAHTIDRLFEPDKPGLEAQP